MRPSLVARKMTFAVAVATLLLAIPGMAIAKGRARSFVLEGTIAIPSRDRPEQFLLTGDLRVMDCRGTCETRTWQQASAMRVKVKIARGQFFATRDPVYSAGAVRDPRSVLALLRDAAAHHHHTRLELVDAKIRFGPLGDVVEVEARVERMFDFHMGSTAPFSGDQCGRR